VDLPARGEVRGGALGEAQEGGEAFERVVAPFGQ
jgi:hypothetical protein